jgi:hypothetical protein
MTNQTAEILPMETGSIAVYNPFRSQLAELKKLNSSLVFDYEDPKGNKDARSHVFKLRRTKSALEDARKAEKQQSLEYGRKVDGEAKEINAELEAMIEVHQKVIDEIEQRDKKRIEAIQVRIANIAKYQECAGHDSTETAKALETLRAIIIDGAFGEFQAEAQKVRELSIRLQEAEHASAVKREAEAVELERLRKANAEREQQERDERIRQEAASKATAEAERIAAEALAASDKRVKDAEDAKKAAEEKAARDAQTAVEAERKRVAEAERKDAEETATRAADTEYRAKINNEALNAIIEHCNSDKADITPEIAKSIIKAIAKGLIPHIKIIY